MNFDLEEKLFTLVEEGKLNEAIQLAEKELKEVPNTDCHQVIGKDLKHLAADLKEYIKEFEQSTTAVLKKKQGFIKSLLSPKKNIKPAAYYCEMNGFTINYDRWFLDLFAYESYGKHDLDDWDWLADFYDLTHESLTITGFEAIQKAYQKAAENDRLKEPIVRQAYDICELLVILRLQELFQEVYLENNWTKTPMFVTAHDYELIYQAN